MAIVFYLRFTIYDLLVLDILYLLTSQTRQFHWVFHSEQGIKSSTHHIVRISRTQNLRAYVMNTNGLHHRPHCASGNHAGTLGCRFNQNAASAKFSNQLMWNRVLDQRHANQTFLGGFDSLLDRLCLIARPATYVDSISLHVDLALLGGGRREQ